VHEIEPRVAAKKQHERRFSLPDHDPGAEQFSV
jgi:hypothetical protein